MHLNSDLPVAASRAVADERPAATVLIVDDDRLTRRLVVDTLAAEPSLHLIEETDGARAIDLLGRDPIDAVVCDLVLPGADGPAVLAHVRALGDDAPAFLMLTGTARVDVLSEALSSGAADYLRKPFEQMELRARVGAALRHRDERRRMLRTERMLTLERDRLAASEIRSRSIVDTAVDAIITIDGGGVIRSFNPAAERIFGWPADEVIGRNVSMLMPEPDRSAHNAYVQGHEATGERRVIGIGREVLGLRRDGSNFPMHLSVGEMQVGGERLYTGIVRDISEAKRLERELRDSEIRNRSIVETAISGIVTVDERGVIEDVNPALESMFGYSRDEMVGSNIALLMPEPHRSNHGGYLRRYNAGGEASIIGRGREVLGKRKNGTLLHAHLSVGEMTVGGRRMFTGLLRDVTDRVRAEQELRRQNTYVHQLLNSVQDGIIVVGHDERVLDVNERFCEMTGFSREEVLSAGMPRPWWDPAEGETIANDWAQACLAGGAEFDAAYVHRSGEVFPVIVGVSVLPDDDGLASAHIAIVKDVTERHRQSRRLAQMADEQAALRRVAEAVANNARPEATFGMAATEIATLLNARAVTVWRVAAGRTASVGSHPPDARAGDARRRTGAPFDGRRLPPRPAPAEGRIGVGMRRGARCDALRDGCVVDRARDAAALRDPRRVGGHQRRCASRPRRARRERPSHGAAEPPLVP